MAGKGHREPSPVYLFGLFPPGSGTYGVEVVFGDECVFVYAVDDLADVFGLFAFDAGGDHVHSAVHALSDQFGYAVSAVTQGGCDLFAFGLGDNIDLTVADGKPFLNAHAEDVAGGIADPVTKDGEGVVGSAEHVGDGDDIDDRGDDAEDPDDHTLSADDKEHAQGVKAHIDQAQ